MLRQKKRYVAIICAAGLSTRFGSQKLLFRINGLTLIEKTLGAFLKVSEIEKIFTVVGYKMDELKKVLSDYPVEVVYNPLFFSGMSSSIKAGLACIDDDDEVFIHLADKPFVRPELIRFMIEISKERCPHIIVPAYEGKKGHPVLVGPGSYLRAISNIEGDVGLRHVIERESKNVLYLPYDETVLLDIDTIEDLEILKRREDEKGKN